MVRVTDDDAFWQNLGEIRCAIVVDRMFYMNTKILYCLKRCYKQLKKKKSRGIVAFRCQALTGYVVLRFRMLRVEVYPSLVRNVHKTWRIIHDISRTVRVPPVNDMGFSKSLLVAGVLVGLQVMPVGVIGADTVPATSSEADVDVVWSAASGGSHEIFYVTRLAGQWSAPQMVTDDRYDNQHPVIDRDHLGRLWVAWTAYDNRRMEIRYSVGSDGSWQYSAAVASSLPINISPSLVVGDDGVVWLAWSASDNGPDDIYVSTNAGGIWSEPARVHAENDRIDVLPVIEIDADGTPMVFWKGLTENGYMTFYSRFAEGAWGEEQALAVEEAEATDEDEETELELPAFVEQSGMVFIRLY